LDVTTFGITGNSADRVANGEIRYPESSDTRSGESSDTRSGEISSRYASRCCIITCVLGRAEYDSKYDSGYYPSVEASGSTSGSTRNSRCSRHDRIGRGIVVTSGYSIASGDITKGGSKGSRESGLAVVANIINTKDHHCRECWFGW
jgi:hypothetical protein